MAQSRKLQAMCVRTKMCKYFLTGSCRNGGGCAFAHSVEELQAAPDLHCTKLCPTLVETGRCANGECTFAHGRDQLRKVELVLRPGRDSGRQGQSRRAQLQRPADTEPVEHATLQRALQRTPTAADAPAKELLHGGVGGMGEGDQEVSWCRQSGRPGSSASTPSEISEWEWGTPTMSRQATESDLDLPTSPAVGPQPSGQTAGGQRPLRNKFHKTKLCQFFQSGRCRKRSCNFAHSREELAALPDLRYTKMCPAVRSGGVCADGACSFAHAPSELRTSTPSPEMRSPEPGSTSASPTGKAGPRMGPGLVQGFALELTAALQVVRAAGFDVRPAARTVPQLRGATQPPPSEQQLARCTVGPTPQASMPAGLKGDSARVAASHAEWLGRREPLTVVVKNTFLHVPEPAGSETPGVLRRTRSAIF